MSAPLAAEEPSPVMEVALDMLRRGAFVAPIAVGVGTAIWGAAGAAAVAYAIAIVLGNLALSAYMLSQAARISTNLLMGAALFGFIIRMGLIFVAVIVVRDATWLDLVPLGITLIVAHLGLLVWELRYVSATLAHPGLKPGVNRSSPLSKESVQP